MAKITIEFEKDYLKELQVRLREYGISQVALANETGIDQSQISRWLHKKMTPRLETIVEIERAIARIQAREERRL